MKYWSTEDTDYLKQYYTNKTNQELADILGKTLKAVGGKIYRLGLPPKRDFRTPVTKLNGRSIQHTRIGSKARAESRYYMLKYRVTHTDRPKNRTYAGVELLVSKEDFIPWFMERDFKGCSVDRIDNTGHYELTNMQVIPLVDNIAKDKRKAKDGRATCCRCNKNKPLMEFVKSSRSYNGYTTICKPCERERTRKRNGSSGN